MCGKVPSGYKRGEVKASFSVYLYIFLRTSLLADQFNKWPIKSTSSDLIISRKYEAKNGPFKVSIHRH